MFIIAQIFGFLAMIVNIIAFQLKNKHSILITSCLSNLFFMIGYILLHAYIGAFVCAGYIFVILIDILLEKKGSDTPTVIVLVYLLFLIVIGIFQSHNVVDVLPLIASAIGLTMLKIDSEQKLRVVRVLSSAMWLIYDFVVESYGALASDTFIIIALLIALYRYRNIDALVR